jgi:hypothetical protein
MDRRPFDSLDLLTPNLVNGDHVGVVEAGRRPGFLNEPLQPLSVLD